MQCPFSLYLKPRPRGGVKFIGYAIETLRDEAPLHAASTLAVEAVLAVGHGNVVGAYVGALACPPRLGLRGGFVVVLSGRCGISATLILLLRAKG